MDSNTLNTVVALKPFETLEEVVAGLEQIKANMPVQDRRIIFLQAYLMVNQKILRLVDNNHFDDAKWVSQYCAVFGDQYRMALLNYERREFKEVPQVWKIAFDMAKDKKLLMPQHLALGMNAHLGRDLSYTVSEIVFDDHPSRYSDHNRINDALKSSIVESQILFCKIYPKMLRLFLNFIRPIFIKIGMHTFLNGRERAWCTGIAVHQVSTEKEKEIWKQHEKDAISRARKVVSITRKGPLGKLRSLENNIVPISNVYLFCLYCGERLTEKEMADATNVCYRDKCQEKQGNICSINQ